MNDAVRLHEARVTIPAEGEEFDKWVALEDATTLLRADLKFEFFVLYSDVGDVFMHAVLVPNVALNPPDFKDLMGWNFNPYRSGWGCVYSFHPPDVRIEPPLHGCGSRAMASGEQLLFMRSFEGYDQKGTYAEILQKLLHVFGLHYIEERNAYCRLDTRGDLEDIIGITHLKDPNGEHRGGTVVTIRRDVLDEYMAVTDMSVVRMFDLTRTRRASFGGWSDDGENDEREDGDLYFRRHIERGRASYMRGVQIVPSGMSKDAAARRTGLERPTERKYESFIAVDRRHSDAVREISTEPDKTANYFSENDLPWEVSPAFFRPEVLLRYKADTGKYSMAHRSISCRGAWSLQTYDINDAGQVHTYIVYLRDLPHEEQLYWKAHNEAPKGPMSARAITTDLLGKRYSGRDAIEGIRRTVDGLNSKPPSWWSPRSGRIAARVHYVVTTSEDEWASEMLNLDQFTVEGFRTTALREHAVRLGRTGLDKLGSLKLVEQCLIGLGWDEERAREVTAPLHELHYIRSKIKAHDGGAEVATIRKSVLKEHKTFVKHSHSLCSRCDEAMAAIAKALAEELA